MNKFRSLAKSHALAASLLFIGFLCILSGVILLRAQSGTASASPSDEALIASCCVERNAGSHRSGIH